MKPSQYKLIIKSPAGEKRAAIVDPVWVRCVRRVNQPGELDFALESSHEAVASLEDRSLVELWRKNADRGREWYCEGRFIYLCQEKSHHPGRLPGDGHTSPIPYPDPGEFPGTEERENAWFTARCPGALWLLATRVVAYPLNLANLSIFTGASGKYIAERVVDTNCGPNATAGNRRLRDGAISGLSVDVYYQAGDYYLECCGQNVLELVQFIAGLEERDFDLLYTESGGWQFRFYDETAGMGADRRGQVRFSLSFDNIGKPRYVKDCRREKTVGIVAGAETAAGALYEVVYSDDYSPEHDQEIFIDANDVESVDMLAFAGAAQLRFHRAVERIEFDVLQTPGLVYARDYFLGDLVTGKWADIEVDLKISGIELELHADGSEMVKIRTRKM